MQTQNPHHGFTFRAWRESVSRPAFPVTLAVLALIFLYSPLAVGDAEQQTCFAPSLDFKNLTAQRQKYGWEESHFEVVGGCQDAVFPSDPPKIRVFKTCTIDTFFTITNYMWPEFEVITPKTETIKVTDVDTGEIRTVELSGHAVCTNGPNGCESFLTLEGGWSPCDVCPQVEADFNDLMDLYPYAQFHSFVCNSTPTTYADQSLDGVDLLPTVYSVRNSTNYATLDDEYTTDDLVSRVKADLDAQTYPDFWGGGNCASLSWTDNEKQATVSKFKVKFSFQTQAGYHYTLKWKERTTLGNDGSCSSSGVVQPDSDQAARPEDAGRQ